MNIKDILLKRTAGNLLAILAIAVFLILGIVRLYPYTNDLAECLKNDPGDDWWTYARYGIDIAKNGILLPSVRGVYDRPASFLYNYFIAFSFSLFGQNLIPVYLIQHLLTGLAAALAFWTYRDKMRSSTALVFLAALFLFTLLDVYKQYAVRLLGENLAFFAVPLFFFSFIRGIEKDSLKLQLFSAFLMGAIILIRPNTLLFGFALVPVAAAFYLKKRRGVLYLLLFVVIMALTASALAARNYLVSREWKFLPKIASDSMGYLQISHPIPAAVDLSGAGTCWVRRYIEYMRQEPALFFGHYLKKIAFCFGFNSILDSHYRVRPHWMVMWLGYIFYLSARLKERKRLEVWELTTHLYILCYYGTLVAFAQVENYGFRQLIPATNSVLLFSFLALDRLRGGAKNENG